MNVSGMRCKKHPRYKMMRRPNGKCKTCVILYKMRKRYNRPAGVAPSDSYKVTN